MARDDNFELRRQFVLRVHTVREENAAQTTVGVYLIKKRREEEKELMTCHSF